MRDDIRELQDALTATQFACVPPGVRSTSDDIYPAVRREYPELCDDDWRPIHGQRHSQWDGIPTRFAYLPVIRR